MIVTYHLDLGWEQKLDDGPALRELMTSTRCGGAASATAVYGRSAFGKSGGTEGERG
jgi:hypothetical protein